MNNSDFPVCPRGAETFKTTSAQEKTFVHAVKDDAVLPQPRRVIVPEARVRTKVAKTKQEQIRLKLGKVHVTIKNAHEVRMEERDGKLVLLLSSESTKKGT